MCLSLIRSPYPKYQNRLLRSITDWSDLRFQRSRRSGFDWHRRSILIRCSMTLENLLSGNDDAVTSQNRPIWLSHATLPCLLSAPESRLAFGPPTASAFAWRGTRSGERQKCHLLVLPSHMVDYVVGRREWRMGHPARTRGNMSI